MPAAHPRFENKVVLVTGGATGLGKVMVHAFALEGAAVVFTDINNEHGPLLEQELKAGKARARFVRSDATQADQVEQLIATIVATFGRLDVAVNNAGGIIAPDQLGSAVHDTLEAGWENNIALNLTGVFLGMKYAIRQMLEQGGGVIVNTGSVAGMKIDTSHTSVAYSAAKAGMIHMSKWAAVRYAEQNIRINVVAPGAIATEATKAFLSDELKSELSAKSAMRRMSEPEEIVRALLWLCSDDASGITGVTLPVDGGMAVK